MAAPAQLQQARQALAVALELLTDNSSSRSVTSARELLLEYGQFVAAQPNVASFCLGALQAEAASLPQSYLSQQGGALRAVSAAAAVGFVAWRTLPRLHRRVNARNCVHAEVSQGAIKPLLSPCAHVNYKYNISGIATTKADPPVNLSGA